MPHKSWLIGLLVVLGNVPLVWAQATTGADSAGSPDPDPHVEVRKYALLFGGEVYDKHPAVTNAWNDVNTFAQTLLELGFDSIQTVVRPTKNEVVVQLTKLRHKAEAAERETGVPPLLVVFFAGHGFQIHDRNYFLPVDAEKGDARTLEASGVPQSFIEEKIGFGRFTLGIVILDICRVDLGWVPSSDETEDQYLLRGGLAREEADKGTNVFVIYATSQGHPARSQVTSKDNNSPFTRSYTATMLKHDLELYRVYQLVKSDVRGVTNFEQDPNASPGSTSQFYFSPGSNYLVDMMKEWRLARESPTRKNLEHFLETYPTSGYAAVTLQRIKSLGDNAD